MSIIHARQITFGLVALVTAAAVPALRGAPLAIRIEEKAYAPGDKVVAKLEANGKVTLENDLKGVSEAIEVKGEKTVELGKIPGPGFFVIKASDGTEKATAVVFVAPGSKENTLDVTVSAGSLKAPAVTEALMTKFIKAITWDRLKSATQAVVKAWLKENVGALGTTTTLCLVCVTPGGQFACGACASSGGGNTVDLGIEILKKVINDLEADKVITKEEADTLRTFVVIGQGFVALRDVKDAPSKLEKALAGLKLVVKEAFTDGDVNVFIGNGADEGKKAAILIRLLNAKPK